MEMQAVRAQKELILLHRPDAETPKNTADWLNARGWCTSHHHIRCPKRVFSKKSANKMVTSNYCYMYIFFNIVILTSLH